MNPKELVEKLIGEILTQLEIEAQVSVEEEEENIVVTLETPDAGILIGHHGRNLEALQTVVSQMVFKQLGVWKRVLVSVGDYRQKREAQLKEMAQSAAQQVIETGAPVAFSDMTPSERRIVHMELSEHAEVVSESEGEGRHRKLIVKPRS